MRNALVMLLGAAAWLQVIAVICVLVWVMNIGWKPHGCRLAVHLKLMRW
jgi:hypothetical protein